MKKDSLLELCLMGILDDGAITEKKTRGQRGRSKATIDLIATCSKIIEQVQPITVRGVCYRLFVAGMIDSMAVNNTQKISRLLVEAREAGTIPWEWIVDESRQMERQPHWSDLTGYAKSVEQSYRRDFWAHQPYRVVVISEKATVTGILRSVLEDYGVPFFAVHGFNSATKVHFGSTVRRQICNGCNFARMILNDLAKEIACDDRQTVLLYVGDYDPSGLYMSEQDLPGRLANYGADNFHFERIALVKSDLPGLPSFDAKKTDPRHRWFVEKYGEDSWELDAMDPNELRDRVAHAIANYINPGDWEQHKKIEEAQRETTKRIASALVEMKVQND